MRSHQPSQSKTKGWSSWAAAEISSIHGALKHCNPRLLGGNDEMERNVLTRTPLRKIIECAQKEHLIGCLQRR